MAIQQTDNIEVEMHLYEKNIGLTSVVTTGSEDRSMIGKYFNAVKKALQTGDNSGLQPFRNHALIDADGVVHQFETDLENLYEIEDAQEEPEFFEIYSA